MLMAGHVLRGACSPRLVRIASLITQENPMTKLSAMLATTIAALALVGAATAADKTSVKAETTLEHDKNGGYEKTTSSEKVTPAGKVSSETETTLTVDDNGDSEKTSTTKHVNDPKGLLNKRTEKVVVKRKNNESGTTVERTHKIDGKTVLDSSTEVTK